MFYADILAKNTYRYTDIPIHIDCNRLTVQFQLRNTHTHTQTNTYNLAKSPQLSHLSDTRTDAKKPTPFSVSNPPRRM